MSDSPPATTLPKKNHEPLPEGDSTDALLEAEAAKAEAEGHGAEDAEGDEIPTLEHDEDLAIGAQAEDPASAASQKFVNWGKLGHLTEKEEKALEEFMKQIPEEDLTQHKNPHDTVTHFALRWLRARDFKVKDSVEMFRNHKKWVTTSPFYALQFAPLHEIVGTKEVDDNFIIQHYPCGIKGYDRLGRPLYIKHYGKMKPKYIAKKVDAEHAAQWESVIGCLRLPYVLGESSRIHGRHVEEMCAIIDCKGFKLKTFNKYVREVLKRASETTNPNYPEALGICIVVNAPWFVKTIWAVAKGFLAKRTRKKFRILGKKFHAHLHAIVDPSNLPVEYGGTGEKGFKSLDELFVYDKAFAIFNTPEYHAAVAADPRNKAFLVKAKAQAEAGAIKRKIVAEQPAVPPPLNGGGAKAPPVAAKK